MTLYRLSDESSILGLYETKEETIEDALTVRYNEDKEYTIERLDSECKAYSGLVEKFRVKDGKMFSEVMTVGHTTLS